MMPGIPYKSVPMFSTGYGAIRNPEEHRAYLQRRKDLFEEAATRLSEFLAAAFPHVKNDEGVIDNLCDSLLQVAAQDICETLDFMENTPSGYLMKPQAMGIDDLMRANEQLETAEHTLEQVQSAIKDSPKEFRAIVEATQIPPLENAVKAARDYRDQVQKHIEAQEQKEPQE